MFEKSFNENGFEYSQPSPNLYSNNSNSNCNTFVQQCPPEPIQHCPPPIQECPPIQPTYSKVKYYNNTYTKDCSNPCYRYVPQYNKQKSVTNSSM